MNLVDSSAWLEYFADGPNAGLFEPLVAVPARLLVPTIVLYEVFKVVLREAGERAAFQSYAALQKGTVLDLTPSRAVAASRASLEHGLPMADAIIYAAAIEHKATLWTQDPRFKSLPGVRFVPKKGSSPA